ncbi:PIN domain-containing protein [Thioalkalivibrio sp. XN279]|uniref:PIN domain-containing protein n=1 Tax=Thioalkalivibrio sp. XN279 TaxID=2714953 RepID=UPI00140C4A73|nr:PIN domain-containing protein [Thioalkalivibrio sp. XN279]NHA15344.1 type II toxin-antitoxin system VapC family toxin [Thioalkalivibrio sp. XN279]
MILVDTNVISEPLRNAPEARVVAWIDAQPLETLLRSTITVAELRFGVASLPASRRRDTLRDNLETRVLPLIAATALAHRMMVATRDTAPFEAACVAVLNPWMG